MFREFLLLICLFPTFSFGQIAYPSLPQPLTRFSFEDKDWAVAATANPKKVTHGPTPTTIPGARTIKTLELKALLDAKQSMVIVDVLDSKTRTSIPGAIWMFGAGDGQFFGAEKSRFSAALEKLTAGDKSKPVVFLCTGSECWQSYNASLYAVEAGYKDVIWYRGGTSAWAGASLDRVVPETIEW